MVSQPQDFLESVRDLPSFAVDNERHLVVIKQLTNAFEAQQPVAVLAGDSPIECSHVMGAYLANLADRATIVRLKDPHTDAIVAMREINRALGFAPKALSLVDQRNILTMFLECQTKYRRRTVLSIEQVDQQPLWLLDTIAGLVDPQTPGLTITLSGGSGLEEFLSDPSLEVFRSYAARAIRLAPFTLRETRDFIRKRIETSGLGEVSRVFDFGAVDHLHKVSGGRPDAVGKLCQQSLQQTNPSESRPVSVESVALVARQLGLESVDNTLTGIDIPGFDQLTESIGQLVVQLNGRSIQELPLSEGNLLVGRDVSADICLPGSLVSRRHALIRNTGGSATVADLGSKNGTFVRGQRVTEQRLEPGDIVSLGDFEIQYKVF
jgi:type II secretory pathway predicted ATPase ExeA